MLGALLAEPDQTAAQFGVLADDGRQGQGPLGVQLRDGQLTVGAARITGDEHRLAGLRRRRPPGQMVRRRCRLAVLVQPHEGAIEVVAGEVEIVGIAAEKGRREPRREHQPHV